MEHKTEAIKKVFGSFIQRAINNCQDHVEESYPAYKMVAEALMKDFTRREVIEMIPSSMSNVILYFWEEEFGAPLTRRVLLDTKEVGEGNAFSIALDIVRLDPRLCHLTAEQITDFLEELVPGRSEQILVGLLKA